MDHCSLVVDGDLVAGGPSVEAVKEELEMAVIRVVIVEGGVIHIFPQSGIIMVPFWSDGGRQR